MDETIHPSEQRLIDALSVEVTNAELLAHIARLEAIIVPMASFIEMLELALKNHPMAKALGMT
jgi:hypothetical protein